MGLGIFDLTKCSDLGYKDRIDIYKETGVGELSLYIDNDYMQEGEDYNLIIAYARDNGLKINQVHIDYKQSNLICDETTDSFFEYISKKAHECMMLNIPYMVLHPSKGENPPEISQKQLDKLKMVVSKFPNVMFCFENVRSIKNLKKILALDVNNIKACYDLGHAHAYYDEFELFDELKNKIQCTHLHNNYGKDEHRTLKDGEIDYKKILKKLSSLPNVSNCIEAFPQNGTVLSKEEFKQFVKNCLDI